MDSGLEVFPLLRMSPKIEELELSVRPEGEAALLDAFLAEPTETFLPSLEFLTMSFPEARAAEIESWRPSLDFTIA